MKRLVELYHDHRGRVSDRWSSNLAEYDRLLGELRDKPIRMLEIGVQNGGSLEIWSQFFPSAQKIVGCDIDPACAELRFDDPRLAVVVADATTEEGQRQVAALSPAFELIVDDGSHRSGDIIRTFARYFSMLSVDGFFVAEDLHCSYWQQFEGGLNDPFSAVSFFKRLADILNHEHWGVAKTRAEHLRHFEQRYDLRFDDVSLQAIGSMEFLNSMCVVRRRESTRSVLGPRVVVGTVEAVRPGALLHHGSASMASDQRENPWGDRAIPIEYELRRQNIVVEGLTQAVAERDVRVVNLRQTIAERDGWIDELTRERARQGLKIDELTEILAARDRQISEMILEQSTFVARTGRLIRHAGNRWLPAGTVGRRLLSRGVRFAETLYRNGIRATVALTARGLRARSARRLGLDGLLTNGAAPGEYARWIAAKEPSEKALARQRRVLKSMTAAPLISVILPVYKVPPAILRATVKSLLSQTYAAWEACVTYADTENDDNWRMLEQLAATDPRIRLQRLPSNKGIAGNSNEALAIARGEFIALLDHDDELTPWALYDMAVRIAADPAIDFLYSDKDRIDADGLLRQSPLFKPCWSPEMLYSVNYLTHLNVIRRSIVEAVGGWRPETDGAQDWDIFYRVTERCRKIERVVGVGYHWRILPSSTSTGREAKPYAALGQLRTQEDRVRRLGLPTEVIPNLESGFKLLWRLDGRPCVDLVVRAAVTDAQLERCLGALQGDLGGLVASVRVVRPADQRQPTTVSKALRGGRIEYVSYGASGETEAMFQAAKSGAAPVLVFVDASLARFGRGWLPELTGWTHLHPEIAFAGAIVLANDDRVVEAGRITGQDGASAPLFRDTPLYHWGVFGGPLWFRNVSAVSPIAAAFRRDDWETARERDTRRPWPDAFVTCCLGTRAGGRRGMVTPHARVYLDAMPKEASPAWDASFGADPYFHPAFRSVVPLRLER